MLSGHGQEDFLERIRIVIDQGENATEAEDKVVQEPTVDFGLNAIYQNGQGTRNDDIGLGSRYSTAEHMHI